MFAKETVLVTSIRLKRSVVVQSPGLFTMSAPSEMAAELSGTATLWVQPRAMSRERGAGPCSSFLSVQASCAAPPPPQHTATGSQGHFGWGTHRGQRPGGRTLCPGRSLSRCPLCTPLLPAQCTHKIPACHDQCTVTPETEGRQEVEEG